MNTERVVREHYSGDDLEAVALGALRRVGVDVDALRVEDLAGLDQFHAGSIQATEHMLDALELTGGATVLDVGSGVGGPARLAAARHGCRVTGIDLSPDFVDLARKLTERVGLGDLVTFDVGSATAMPYDDGSFNRAMLNHVGMNIAAKDRVFAEVRRVLEPDGVFAVYEQMRVGDGDLAFPMPWAEDETSSFVETRERYAELLRAAGFRIEADEDRTAAVAAAGPPAAGALTPGDLFGPEFAERIGNNLAATFAGTLGAVLIVARRGVTSRPGGFSDPGNCHRIALAVHDGPGVLEQWRHVFGAGVMFDTVHDELDGSDMGMVWMGDVPFLALASADPDGLVGRWLAKHGPGVQSLAWEVPDMWASQNHLLQAGIGITGVHIEGRHFFMHPRDTFGLMLELTDDRLPGDPRNGLSPTGGGDGLVQVSGVAHVAAVVVELDPVAALLHQVFGAEPRPVAGNGPEAVADFAIGDLTLRVVAPLDETSPWHEVVAGGRGTLHSVALAVELDTAPGGLDAAGIRVVHEEPGSLWLDPADTFGIRLQLVPQHDVPVRPHLRRPSGGLTR